VCYLYVCQRHLRYSNTGYVIHCQQVQHMLCEHSQDTYSIHTYTQLKKTWKCAVQDRTITICILWGFHSRNIEPTTEQTCLVSPRMKPIFTFVSSQIYVILWDSTYTAQQTIMCHLGESYVQEKTREPSMEGQLWQREGLQWFGHPAAFTDNQCRTTF